MKRKEESAPVKMYMVQWHYHDREKWYSYGTDGISPPTVFDVLSDAREIFEKMVSGYYADVYRIIDMDGNVVAEKPSGLASRPDDCLPSLTLLWRPK